MLITGAASGIGAATARRFAAEGARLMLGDVNAQGLSAVAKELDLKTVAEGVETVEQMKFLIALGCSNMQGYLFGHPVDAAEFESEWRDRERIELPTSD